MKKEKTVEICCVDGFTVDVVNPNIEKLEGQMKDDRVHLMSVKTKDKRTVLIPKEKIIMMLIDGAE